MKILNVLSWMKNELWGAYYRSQLESVGRNVLFLGTHITIIGGKRHLGNGISIGNNCTIYDLCQLVSDDCDERCGIKIGDNCHFNFNCYLCGTGGLAIGDNCIFGPGAKVIPTNHRFEDVDRMIIEQGHEDGPVSIGADVWVGAGAIILPNVRIGKGAVISAGAVVTKEVEENAVVAGVPARFVRTRGIPNDTSEKIRR